MIYPLTIILVLLAGGASAAILIIAAWDPDFRNFVKKGSGGGADPYRKQSHFDPGNPGDESHSFMSEEVSVWRAFLRSASRCGPRGKASAFSRS